MLRKRSRAVSNKQGLMSDHPSLPSPTGKYSRPIAPSLFGSPRLFVGFSSKGSSDPEVLAMSPTSILETKPFSSIGNPFFTDGSPRKPHPETTSHHPWDNGSSGAIGLGIVDALGNDDKPDKKSSKPESRMVLFGSQLKIQIPSIHPRSISPAVSVVSPHPPIEFGVKNKNSQLALLSPARRSPVGSANFGPGSPPSSPGAFAGCLSAIEMEMSMSEDYTCVIAHGPNPRTTHIFNNCVVESCCGGRDCDDAFPPSRKELMFEADRPPYPSDDFLAFCYACKKNLGQGKDIYMYRGEKAFCSSECRYQEMLFDEGMEKALSDPSAAL